MQSLLEKFKKNPVMYVNILFTIFCFLSSVGKGALICCFAMWLIVPIFMDGKRALESVVYMSLYMRIFLNIKLFAIVVSVSILIILIKKIFVLNKNKLLNKYLKIFLIYAIFTIVPLLYSVLLKNSVNIQFVYYLNMINLLFLIYLLKNEIDYKIILIYSYGIVVSSVISLISYAGGIYAYAFEAGNRFCAYMQLCNTLGVACAVCISAIYIMFKNQKISARQSLILISMLSVIGCMTLSKNFLIIWAIILLTIFAFQIKDSKNKKGIILKVVLISVVISPLVLYYGVIMIERFLVNPEYNNIVDILTTGRLEKWLIYLKPWCKNILSIIFGLGLTYDYGTPNSSHSFYVGYLSRLGIVGLVALCGFIYLIVFRKNESKTKFKYFSVIIILIICLAEDLSFNTFNFIPFIIACVPMMCGHKDQQM